ncbi:MAG: hypothetical protein Q7T76_05305 [Ferruginibacter sp.]|nr:hypothetical protein [Ferruginibacter sp.]
MLSVSVVGLNYQRVLVQTLSGAEANVLRSGFDYSFVISYGSLNDSEYKCTAKNSCVIDLQDGAEKAFSKFNSTSRNEVRRSEKIPDLVFHFGFEDFGFDTYFGFHKACEHDRNWHPVPPDELKKSLLFSASFDGKLISGMSCYTHGPYIRVGRIFSNKRSAKSEILTNLVYGCAAKRIVYEICKHSEQNKFTQLDLGGVDLVDPEKQGISKFKLSLGSQIIPVKLGRWSNLNFDTKEHLIREQGWDLT